MVRELPLLLSHVVGMVLSGHLCSHSSVRHPLHQSGHPILLQLSGQKYEPPVRFGTFLTNLSEALRVESGLEEGERTSTSVHKQRTLVGVLELFSCHPGFKNLELLCGTCTRQRRVSTHVDTDLGLGSGGCKQLSMVVRDVNNQRGYVRLPVSVDALLKAQVLSKLMPEDSGAQTVEGPPLQLVRALNSGRHSGWCPEDKVGNVCQIEADHIS